MNTPLTPGQVAFTAFHGYTASGEAWPAEDKIVKQWEAVGAAVAGAERAQCHALCLALAAKRTYLAYGTVSQAEQLAEEIKDRGLPSDAKINGEKS